METKLKGWIEKRVLLFVNWLLKIADEEVVENKVLVVSLHKWAIQIELIPIRSS